MQPLLLPLFPLNVVLFPGAPLPLHIFEDRYKEMFKEILESKTEFGVVLASEKGLANTGCTAIVGNVIQRYSDGRLDLLCFGRRRFEINLLNEERAFLRGDIHLFEDHEEPAVGQDVRDNLVQAASALGDSDEQLDAGNPQLSFAVARKIPDLDLQQQLLSMRSEAERIRRLQQAIPELVERRKIIDSVRHSAPLNGHSHHLKKDS